MTSLSRPEKRGFDLMSAASPFLRYAPWILLGALLSCLAATAHVLAARPLYQAQTLLKLGSTQSAASRLARGRGEGERVENALETYVEEARSLNVAARTAKRLGLASQARYRGMSPLALADSLREQVSVKNHRSSNLILVQARAWDPVSAAELANAWADSFIQANLEIERRSASDMHRFIQEQLGNIQYRLARSQGQMKARERAGSAAWLNLVEEVKALESSNAWLMEKEKEAFIAEKTSASNILVVDPALPPDSPIYPKRRKSVALATAFGTFLSLGLVWFWLRLNQWVHSEEELEQASSLPFWGLVADYRLERAHSFAPSIPLLGLASDLLMRWRQALLPSSPDPGKGLISRERHANSCYKENFATLRNKLLLEAQEQGVCAVSVFSPGHGEGRSLVNANLALSLARSGKKVLLVDAHFRHPSLQRIFALPPVRQRGLAVLMEPDAAVNGQFENPSPNLWVLPSSHDQSFHGEEKLVTERLTALLGKLKPRFDFILFDPPPLNAMSQAQALAAALDGVLLMATTAKSSLGDIRRAASLLRGLPCRSLGCILNRVDVRYYRRSYALAYQRSGYGRLARVGVPASEA